MNEYFKTVRFQNALAKPLFERCQEIQSIIQESNIKELQSLFPSLVENIFGFGTQTGWELRTITRSLQPRCFDTFRYFLSPDGHHGTLFNLIYKLLGDGFLKYEFPVCCLPVPSCHMLEEGAVPLLYSNKLHYQSPGSRPTNLLLNPFEFYIFHFAYFIVNPSHQKNFNTCGNPTEALYSCLLEDYLRYFLPLEGNTVPSLPISPTSLTFFSRHPLYSSSFYNSPVSLGGFGSSHWHSPHQPPLQMPQIPGSPLHRHSQTSLLKPGKNALLSPAARSSNLSIGNQDSIRPDVWRSEALVVIITEFWLNQATMNVHRVEIGSATSEHFVPTHDHVRVVRIFVKHLHYFVNSCLCHHDGLPYQYDPPSPMEELKYSVVPQLVQKKLYTFLRLCFDRWPFDASFRMPLETWLSYIQPWRYTNPLVEPANIGMEREDKDRFVDVKWKKFITENLCFYTVIFQQLLPRFFRVELSSPKNAYMLFRVTKVFSQPNLSTMISEVESNLCEAPARLLSPSFSSPSVHNVSVSGSLRQQLSDLEGPGFHYKPLFGEYQRSQVQQLLHLITQARVTIAGVIKLQEASQKSWFSELVASFSLNENSYAGDEYNAVEARKVELHLESAIHQLSELFQLPIINMSSSDPVSTTPDVTLVGSSIKQLTPDTVPREDGPHLTPLGRYQLVNGIRKFPLCYQGNPDLQPVRSFEVAFLVRLLHHISAVLNEKYGVELYDLYYRDSFLGQLTRQLLAPPTLYLKTTKMGTSASSPREPHVLPPRINLRFMAYQQTIGYFLGLVLFGYVCGYKPLTVIFLVSVMAFFYCVMKAFFKPIPPLSLSSSFESLEKHR
ncbi:sphingomyelin phosphodiesterase 4-like isoform X2 [Limulus polyphemus]|uniref:Sphingomyelin phosphodiesterase 4-like isoform X2 n=1 Tax=Limulus polyphemus TaxID=6850 RepID=A0ABM1SZT1_LIMPO|nr:sphingomyelin phosphodiesterase 4-like isoform X2 [Limulus polyphemus]